MPQQIIFLHRVAPAKPLPGASCNGCGVCCAAQTCPVARVFLWQFRGPCRALDWDGAAQRYRCALLAHPASYLRWLPAWSESWVRAGVRRWIAAGTGCDSDAELDSENNGRQEQ